MCIEAIYVRVWTEGGCDCARLLRLWRRVFLFHPRGREEIKVWVTRLCQCKYVCSIVMQWMIAFHRRTSWLLSSVFAPLSFAFALAFCLLPQLQNVRHLKICDKFSTWHIRRN